MKYGLFIMFVFSLLFLACEKKEGENGQGNENTNESPADTLTPTDANSPADVNTPAVTNTPTDSVAQADDPSMSGTNPLKEEVPSHPVSEHLDFFTDNDMMRLKAQIGDKEVTLFMIDSILTLPRVPYNAGIKYENEKGMFLLNGKALLVLGETEYRLERDTLKKLWIDAIDRGVDFRAVGEEPGWILEIDDQGYTSFETQFGEVQWEFRTSDAAKNSQKGYTTYFMRLEDKTIEIQIQDNTCFDSMSGESFPKEVAVVLQEKTYYGCGIPL